MENMTRKVERMVRKNAKRRAWRRFVAIPAAIVVFVTTYALILPAIALERDTYCGFEAHQHTEECYTAQLTCGYEDGQVLQSAKTVTELACTASAHQHTEDCFNEYGELVCGYADYLVHEHNADCYNEAGELVCPLPEVKAHTHDESCYVTEIVNVCGLEESAGHVHDESCYTVVSHPELICGQVESAGHVHDESCYTTTEHTYLACGEAESAGHIHDESCYTVTVAEDGTETMELTCGQMESVGHTHTEGCYVTEQVTELTCTLPESAGHTHTDACWADVESLELTCGKTESAGHTHTDSCFAEQSVLICDKPEVIPHVHGDECCTVTVAEDGTETRELTCPLTVVESHQHTAECFTTYEMTVETVHHHSEACYIYVLTCALPEHEHTEECYQAPEQTAAPAVSAELEGEGFPGGFGGFDGPEIFDETAPSPEPVPETPAASTEPEATEIPAEPGSEPEVTGTPAEPETTEEPDAPETTEEPTGDELAPVVPEYICGKDEHTHDESCYDEAGELTCQLEEHTHDASCQAAEITGGNVEIDQDDTPQFAMPELVCGMTEHEHSTNCMDEHMNYACGLTQHTHTGECYDIPGLDVHPILVCDKHEHFHTEACYNEAGELVCGREAHLHDVDCFELPQVNYGIMTLDLPATIALGDGDIYNENAQDLEDHITGVEHDSSMTYYDEVTEKWNTYFDLKFNVSQEDLKNPYFTYELPEGVEVPEELLNDTYWGKSTSPNIDRAFQYQFRKDDSTGKYYLDMKFSDTYVQAAGPDNEAHVRFEAEGERSTTGGNEHFEFSDSVTHDIPADELTSKHDLYVEKKGSYDPTTGKLKYTVTVTSPNGTNGNNVTLDDFLTPPDGVTVTGGPHITVTEKRFQLEGNTKHPATNPAPKELRQGEGPDDYKVNKKGNNEFEMTLPPMTVADGTVYSETQRCGEEYVIEYEYDIDALPEQDFTVGNTVTVNSKVDSKEGSSTVTFRREVIEKSGKVDNENQEIDWTIYVNEAGVDITGWTLSDEMFKDAIDGVPDGVHFEPNEGVTWNGEKYVFTQVDGQPNTKTYTVTYSTKAGYGAHTYHNDVDLVDPDPDGDDGHYGDRSDVGTNFSRDSVDKNLTDAEIQSDGKRVLTWKTEVVIPAEGYTTGAFEDTLGPGAGNMWTANDSRHYMTKAQFDDLINSIKNQPWFKKVDVTVTCAYNNTTMTYFHEHKTLDDIDDSCKITGFKFTVKPGETISPSEGTTGDGKIVLEYKSTVENVKGGTNYTNTFTEPTGDKDTDQYWESTVNKGNNSGQSDWTFTVNEDGTLTWKITIDLGDDWSNSGVEPSLDVVDVLPEGLTLKSLTYTEDYTKTYPEITEDRINDGTFGVEGVFSGTYNTTNRQLTLNVQNHGGLKKGSHIEIVYVCQMSAEILEGLKTGTMEAKTFENKATVTFPGGERESTAKQTVNPIEDTGEDKSIVDKEFMGREQRLLNYRVAINEEGKDLLKDGETDRKLTLTDELLYADTAESWTSSSNSKAYLFDQSYELAPSTVQLYYMNADGTKGEPVPRDLWSWKYTEEPLDEVKAGQDTYWGASKSGWRKVLTVEVPDDTRLILEYSYEVSVSNFRPYNPDNWGAEMGDVFDQTKLKLKNTATLQGDRHDTYDKPIDWEKVDTDADIHTNGLTIYKVSSEDYGDAVADAQFTLRRANDPNSQLAVVQTDAFGTLHVFKDKDGKYKIGCKMGDVEIEGNLQEDVLYYWEETQAPNGYKIPEGGPEKVYFCYLSEGKTVEDIREEYSLDADVKIHVLSEGLATEWVENEPSQENTYVLPETGGMGTQVFTLSGMALIALAGAVFCARRRRAARG